MKDIWLKLNLRQFDGEGAGAAGAGDGGGDSMGASAEAATPQPEYPVRKRNANPLRNVQYGRDAGQEAQEQAGQQSAGDPDQEWQEIRSKRYKKQFDADVQQIIQKRLGASKDAEARLEGMKPMLDVLLHQHGLKEGDYEGLQKAIMDDDSLYEEEALQRGVSVDTLKQIKQLERDNERYKAQEQQTAQQQMFQQHIQKLAEQGEQLKGMYPGFDLRAELQNEQFARLTSPNVGVDVRTAYEIVHKDEILSAGMQYAVQRTERQISNSIRSQGRRPTEAGTKRTAAVDVRSDPSKLTKRDFDEIKRRVMMGDKISY